AVTNNLRGTFVEVSSNIEVIVKVNPRGTYQLQVADVPVRARGATVYFGLTGRSPESLTVALRAGTRSFNLVSPDPILPTPPPAALFTAASAVQAAFLATPRAMPGFQSFVSA